MDIFFLSSTIGSIAFALSGFLLGVRKELDLLGVFIVSMLTANGGGAVRDVLIGKTPAILTDSSAFLLVLAVYAGAMLLKLHRRSTLERNSLFVLSDSAGLVAFAVTGALAGIDAGLSLFGVMVLAFITASGGGILRDAMLGDVPSILSSDFYGSIALLLGAGIAALHHFGHDSNNAMIALFISALMLRLIAWKFGWRLPRMTL